ncbi:MAG: glycerophosphodiester phosphodiesterase [Flavobacteriales bacterium]
MKTILKSILLVIGIALVVFISFQKNIEMNPPIEPTFFAHRGLKNFAENSHEGFLESLKSGIKSVEIDIYTTNDKRLILFHDKNAKRLLGINKEVTNLNWQDIKSKNIIFNKKLTKNKTLLLDDFFSSSYGFETVYIDIKKANKSVADSLLFYINKYNAINKVLVADANPIFLAYLKFKNPHIQTVLEGFNKGKEWTYYLIPNQFKPNYWASFYNQVDKSHINFLKDKNLLDRKIIYGISKNEIETAINKKLKHFIIDY